MITDPIADVLTRIRNAHSAGHRTVRVKTSKMAKSILAVLREEGFIESFEEKEGRPGRSGKPTNFSEIEVSLKYTSSGKPMIRVLKRVSKPGLRQYCRADNLPRVSSGLGISLISTSQGVISDGEARKRKVGGEIIAAVS